MTVISPFNRYTYSDFNLAGVALTGLLDLAVSVGVGRGSDRLGDRNSEVVGDFDLRLYIESCLERDAVVVNRDDVEFGLADNFEFLSFIASEYALGAMSLSASS